MNSFPRDGLINLKVPSWCTLRRHKHRHPHGMMGQEKQPTRMKPWQREPSQDKSTSSQHSAIVSNFVRNGNDVDVPSCKPVICSMALHCEKTSRTRT
mmetsp:Transcript_469/g.1528  ORF Transcript_469/g.1528 Transcript_469/m.1528 type:complete len:97 (+) Transcript_469:541-831(+)